MRRENPKIIPTRTLGITHNVEEAWPFARDLARAEEKMRRQVDQ